MFYDRKYFLQLVPHIKDANCLNRAIEALHKAAKDDFDRQKNDIEAAARDAKAISIGLEADPNSASFKIAQAFLQDAQNELEAAKNEREQIPFSSWVDMEANYEQRQI